MSRNRFYLTLRKFSPTWLKRLFHRFRGWRNGKRSTGDVFSEIYQSKQWGSAGDFNSGAGTAHSNIAEEYIARVSQYLQEHSLTGSRFVDIGCGDFRIGARFAALAGSYVGVEVVPSLVDHLQRTHSNTATEFVLLDATTDPLPDGDVCFLRQVLQHLSNAQIQKILPKLSTYRCVIVTEHIPSRKREFLPNLDKQQGPDIRLYWDSGVLLCEEPFNLPAAQVTEILSVKGTPMWEGHDSGEIVTWTYLPKGSLP
jgi:SAM-dependent methyltransferase